jgi:peroxidase
MGNEITFRSIDGTNDSSPSNTNTTNSPEARIAPPNFAPGTTNGLVDGPNPREISNVVSSGDNADAHDGDNLSAWMYVWGQFVDHDLDLTPQDTTNHINIAIPADDPSLPGGGSISLSRFKLDPATGTAENTVTGWMDASQIYGSDQKTADSLRLPDGHLKTSDGDNLPITNGMFAAGDVRASENPDLTSVTTLWVREHNYQVDRLAKDHPDWSGDQLYQNARAIVTAEIENITYTEFIPHLLGTPLPDYQGYKSNVDPRITQEFSTAAFRFGHSIVSGTETKLDNMGNAMGSQDLSQAFFDTPHDVEANDGVDALIRNFASDPAQANDVYAINDLRNLLAASPDFMDLIAIDIQRERDLGIGTLNQTREALGLPAYTSFDQISSDPAVQHNLEQVFGSVDNVDLFIGGLAEDHIDGGMVGCTFNAILADQFENLRDGDPNWWQNQGFDQPTTDMIQNTTLADIIDRNTNTTVSQSDVFGAESRHPSNMPAEDDGPQLVMGVNDDGATIAGGEDDDTIVAGLGKNQTLTGGGGNDVFVLSDPGQSATISDWQPGDKIDFHMTTEDLAPATISSSNGHAVVSYDGASINLAGMPSDQVNLDSILYFGHAA